MAAEETCDSGKALEEMLQKTTCQKPESKEPTRDEAKSLPGIDIFLNPAKEKQKKEVIKEKKNIAISYFNESNMQTLYPELFRILWESTLPCYKATREDEPMLLSCHFAGSEVDCSELFTKVPTDSGIKVLVDRESSKKRPKEHSRE